MRFGINEIPPPAYVDPRCGPAQCCVCGAKCVLYWLRDDVWAICQTHASCCGGHLCFAHAEEILGRQLTLNDLAVENYLATAKNERENERRVIHCIVDTVIGAAVEAGVDVPNNWCSMWPEYMELGKKLCTQTADAENVVHRLIGETTKHFPDFKNPYIEQ